MERTLLKSKLHRGRITQANLNYQGSITIDAQLMAAADILPHEKVQVVNNNNGARLETYAIAGPPGSGTLCLNGAAARLAQPDDLVIIMTYGIYSEPEALDHQPKIIFLDENNTIVGEGLESPFTLQP